jgi:5'-nucleotidase / UDP-sugar diphosphatase
MRLKSTICSIILLLAITVSATTNITTSIDVYSINDLHGYLTETKKVPGIAKLVTLIKDKQKLNPDGSLLFAAGDMFQGTVESNLLHGRNVIEIMNYAGFDAMCVGNHEFDWGQQELSNNAKLSKFPWLAANVVNAKDGKLPDYLKPYTILKRKGIKIGIIGLATPTTVLAANPKLLKGLKFLDSIETTNKYISKLKRQNVDMIILLTHLGCSQNKETGEITGEAADLAKNVKNVDLIVTGHSHTTVHGAVNGILLVQAGEYGKELGCAHLTINKETNKLISANGEVFNLMSSEYANIKPDKGALSILNKTLEKSDKIKKQVIGSCKTPLLHGDKIDKKKLTILGAFATDLEREKAKADICLLSWGTWRSSLPPSEKAGPITMGDLYMCIPLDNTLYTLDMKGTVIRKVLEYGINNPQFGMLQFSGISVVYNLSKPWMHGIQSVTLLNGKPLDDNKWYKVVTTDFLANGGGGYPFEGKNQHDSGVLTRDIVKMYLEKHPNIDYKLDDRFELIKYN